MNSIVNAVANEISVAEWQVSNVIQLFNEGATVPFISRYRKEKTGGLSDLQVLEISNLKDKFKQLEERKETILKSIEEQDQLTEELKEKIGKSNSLAILEDLYLPFKPKRKTRATIAISKRLEPLAKMIMSENLDSLDAVALKFVSPQKEVDSVEKALQGARDIIAEWINEKVAVRNALRRQFEKEAMINALLVKGKEREGEKYSNYFNWSEKANRAPSYRVLAMFRGEDEGFLKLKIQPDIERAIENTIRFNVRKNTDASKQKKIAITDSVKRLLFPSLETEFRKVLKEKADEAAIKVFTENLRQLLLAPPMGQKNVLAIDPGFKSGCKIVCLDRTGKLMNNDTIYPHPPQRETSKATKKIKTLVNAYKIEAIAIGNGTAGRETEALIKKIPFNRELIAVMVNESGASVYSASEIARREFPEFDVTVRGAVSIGRRLMDPLAELVKIDPKSIGVGQYQHDVNQKLLQNSLQSTVELCVNKVGVDLNTASKELLTYVSGIGPKLAEEIIKFRDQNGVFLSREELKKVKGLGEKAFEQSAGFLKIINGTNPLDSSSVHPESYKLVNKIAKITNLKIVDLVGKSNINSMLAAEDLVDDRFGLPTVKDVLHELEKPGRDPRSDYKVFTFNKNVKSISDIEPGMKLPAIVSNITDFGAFVDLGIKESGLIHKSRIAEEFVKNPSDYIQLNQQLIVKVVEVDVERKRIALTLIGVQQPNKI